jgi:BirA family biotin operon repressor/biotin-[acetyl-CoA-carboxylase] ligase
MLAIDTNSLAGRLETIESIAVISRVGSTNLVARRIVNECIENELSLPNAIIIAREQLAGRGRNDRTWSSPADKGIYATILVSRPVQELPLVPLAFATFVATFLRETFAIDARIKWPNDILVGGRKIAGMLIEARVQDDRVFLLSGVGVNVEPFADHAPPNAVSIREVSSRGFTDLTTATTAFVEQVDAFLSQSLDHETVLAAWRSLAVHQAGEAVECILGDRRIAGRWSGIDDQGRALINTTDGVVAVSAGDLILR